MNRKIEKHVNRVAVLNSLLSTCEIIAMDGKIWTNLQMKLDMLRSKVASSLPSEMEDTMFEVIEFVENFLTIKF